MQLTEEDGIKPGIYRIDFSFVHGVPGIREPENEDCKIPKILERLIEEDKLFTKGSLFDQDGRFCKRTYFPTITNFLRVWKKGYETGTSQFGTSRVYEKLGFEMFYVNWKPGTDFFEIGKHKGVSQLGETRMDGSKLREDLEPIIIIADNNGMNDQYGYLNLGVNDFRTRKVLVFREEDLGHTDEIHLRDRRYKQKLPTLESKERIRFRPKALTLVTPKNLRDDVNYYVWGGSDKFPFHSPNNLKSLHNMWTAVGISPLEIYAAVEDMGFVFPNN